MLLERVYQLERDGKASIIPGIYSFFWDTDVLTAGITLVRSNTIQSDSHFISRYVNIATYTGGASLVLSTATAPLEIQLVDTGSGRFLFDDFVPIQTVCGGVAAGAGNGLLPFIWPEPWLIRAGGTCQCQIKNISAATVSRVKVVLIGLKVYPLRGTLSDLGL